MKAAKAPKTKNQAAAPKLSDSSNGNVDALFLQVAEKISEFENCEREADLKPFDYAGTIKLLDTILTIDQGNRNALNYKGMMLIGLGNNADAIKCFNQILKDNPADKECLNNKGIALYGSGKDKEALKYVDMAINLDRRYADAIMNKAVILDSMGMHDEAANLAAKARAIATING